MEDDILSLFDISQTPIATKLPKILHENNLDISREKFNENIITRTVLFHNTVQKSIDEIKKHNLSDIHEIIKHLMKFWGVFYDDFEYEYTINDDALNDHDKMRLCFQRNVINITEMVFLKK